MARAYAGTVMVEGTTLSEGRGTTRPLELFGAPDIEARAIIDEMRALAPHWLGGCRLRDCWFEPTFHKHVGKLCGGVQIHTEGPYYDHETFRPWRIQALAFKAIRRLHPDYPLWRDFAYEYEHGKLAIGLGSASARSTCATELPKRGGHLLRPLPPMGEGRPFTLPRPKTPAACRRACIVLNDDGTGNSDGSKANARDRRGECR
jgi:hypothetical protein